jgi:hypothetical protein
MLSEIFGEMLGMVVYFCNPALGRLRQKDHKIEISLGYTVRPVSTIKQIKNLRGLFIG